MDKILYYAQTIKYTLADFLDSFLGMSYYKISAATFVITLLTGFVPYFEKYIFFDFFCFVAFNLSMLIDIISAIALSKIRGGSFETNKGMKALIKWVGYNYLLYLCHMLHHVFKSEHVLDSIYRGLSFVLEKPVSSGIKNILEEYNFSPYAIFFYAFVIISLSAIKNLQLSDVFINVTSVDSWVYKNIDIYKNRPTDRLWHTLNASQQEKINKKLKLGAIDNL